MGACPRATRTPTASAARALRRLRRSSAAAGYPGIRRPRTRSVMPGRKKAPAKRAVEAAATAKAGPIVQRAIEDPELRDNVSVAFESAQQAYDRITSTKAPAAKARVEDKKLQDDLRTAAN